MCATQHKQGQQLFVACHRLLLGKAVHLDGCLTTSRSECTNDQVLGTTLLVCTLRRALSTRSHQNLILLVVLAAPLGQYPILLDAILKMSLSVGKGCVC